MRLSFEVYRDKILSLTETVQGGLTVLRPADTALLRQCRVSLARTLTAYHLYAERELFGPCTHLVDLVQKARVKQVSAECAALATDFRLFTRDYGDRPAADQWPVYRAAWLMMIERIRGHLTNAEADVIRCEQAQMIFDRRRAA